MNESDAVAPRYGAYWDGEVWRTGPGRGRCELALDGRPVPGSAWSTATDGQKGAWLLRIATKCELRRCGSFKPRPSSDCPQCGNQPVPLGIDPYKYDQDKGWDWYNGYSTR
jgi:hypothetical protein